MLSDGRPLDDSEPQDVARELSHVFEQLSAMLAKGGPSKKDRPEVVQLLDRLAANMRVWAKLGRWSPRRLQLAEKAAAKLTRGHVNAVVRADAWVGNHLLLQEVPELLTDLLRHLAPEPKA